MKRQYRKIVLLVLDGLRPDAVTDEHMPTLTGLMRRGWQAGEAVTVRPSVTVAALTSIASGVPPEVHGLTEQGMPGVSKLRELRPLPRELRRLGVETTVLLPALGAGARWIAGALLRLGGVTRLRTSPHGPARTVESALRQVEGNPTPEFVVVYLNNADVAGHAWGWMSDAYLRAADALDQALVGLHAVAEGPESLLIVTADHGGGGVSPRDHDAPHPLNDRIPLALLGAGIPAGRTGTRRVHLLDVPPTVVRAFGGTAPAGYSGRIIHEAFHEELVTA